MGQSAQAVIKPPYEFSSETKSSAEKPPETFEEKSNFLKAGGGFIHTDETPNTGTKELLIFVMGSPESEWNENNQNDPDVKLYGYSNLGTEINVFRPGKINVLVNYSLSGNMTASASHWSTDIVPRTLEDAALSFGENVVAASIGIIVEFISTAKSFIKALLTRSAGEATTRLIIKTEGGVTEEWVLFEQTVADVFPGGSKNKEHEFDTGGRQKQIEIDMQTGDPIKIWIELQSTARAWGWAGAISNVRFTVDSIVVNGEPLQRPPIRKDFDGINYDESDSSRFIKQSGSNWQSDGYGNNLSRLWVPNTESVPSSSGFWRLNPTSKGRWEVFVYVPEDLSSTTRANYEIVHRGAVDSVVINQRQYRDEWVSLGTFVFAAQGDEGVRLSNKTGEPEGTTRVQYDSAGLMWRQKEDSQLPLTDLQDINCTFALLPIFSIVFVAIRRQRGGMV